MAMISNIIMVQPSNRILNIETYHLVIFQQTLHHLNSQECAWAFLRIKDLFYEKGPMPLHYNMRMQMKKKSGQRHAIVHKKFDCVKKLRWKIEPMETKTRTQESY